MLRTKLLDAQSAMAFAISQATYIEPQVYRVQYPDIQYPSLIPVDTSAPEWIKSVTYFSMDKAGQARWFNAGAKDVPLAEVNRDKFETGVEMSAIGYAWNLEEISQASMLGINLSTEKAEAARRAAEEFIEVVALSGDANKGFEGLFNNSNVSHAAAANGASTHSDWPRKTPAEILFDVNDALGDVIIDSKTVEIADTVLLPWDSFLYLSTTMLSSSLETTLLQFIRENNAYTAKTKNALDIRGVMGLETAGAGGLDSARRMIVYRKDPGVLKLHMPMPFRFLPVWQDGPMHYEVPGIFRLGGLDIRRPGAVRYRDGI
jgi:hypothetical protein